MKAEVENKSPLRLINKSATANKSLENYLLPSHPNYFERDFFSNCRQSHFGTLEKQTKNIKSQYYRSVIKGKQIILHGIARLFTEH